MDGKDVTVVSREARQAIDALKALDVRCMMLTGDNKATAKRSRARSGEYFAEVLPKNKAATGHKRPLSPALWAVPMSASAVIEPSTHGC